MGKAIRCLALTRVRHRTRGVREPAHVRKLFEQKPGDPRCDRLLSTVGPVGEGQRPKLDKYAPGKSDGGIVSMRRTSKGVQSRQRRDQPLAEFVEKSPPAKGNCVQTTATGTQGLEAALIGLSRVSAHQTRINKIVKAFE
jgi:hypothetical protein